MSQVYWQPGMKLKDVEKLTIEAALSYAGGHRENAAQMLGISLRTMQTKIQLYDLTVKTGETSDAVILPKPKSNGPALVSMLKVNSGKVPCTVSEISCEVLINIEDQVKKNHAGKSFYQLTQDGGLSPLEIYAAAHKLSPKEAKDKKVSPQMAVAWLEKTYGPVNG